MTAIYFIPSILRFRQWKHHCC